MFKVNNKKQKINVVNDFFFWNWDSLQPKLNSYYKVWSYKNKKDKDKKYAWKLIKKNLKIKGGY